ncbi:hypothetical protein ACIGO6_29430 [Streptomyces sp. NPDC053750]|uniref:hypothetical protein n=1 Tax=Streptomyces sp. NPDC053750 TaxID=3365714 RepID=UPI0037D43D3F
MPGECRIRVSGLLATCADLEVAWWTPALPAVLAVGTLGRLKIDVDARVLGVLLLIEVVRVVAIDAADTRPCMPRRPAPSWRRGRAVVVVSLGVGAYSWITRPYSWTTRRP